MEDNDLLEAILNLTNSQKSLPFYRMAIQKLGTGVVEEELGELRYRMQTSEIREPARYFNTLLQKQMATQKTKDPTYMFLADLRSAKFVDHSPTELAMVTPYSKQSLQVPTMLTADFFTTSTNKAKSDKVIARFYVGGEKVEVPMIRGRIDPKGEERGILKPDQGRTLIHLEGLWNEYGCQYRQDKATGAVTCYFSAPIRELAKRMKFKKFGGPLMIRLKDWIFDLSSRPYYIYSESEKGVSFTFLKPPVFSDIVINGIKHTEINVEFSDSYSRQLLTRKTVSRPLDMGTGHSDIGFLLRLYLEPILMKRGEHKIELSGLIKKLNLPKSKWHEKKGQRKQKFSPAILEINKERSIDGRFFYLQVTQGNNPEDYMLLSRLIGAIDMAPANRVKEEPQNPYNPYVNVPLSWPSLSN